jgi:hypothetical protein
MRVPRRLAKHALTDSAHEPHWELLPHQWISADYSLPSWERQVQTELSAKDEGEEQQAQER